MDYRIWEVLRWGIPFAMVCGVIGAVCINRIRKRRNACELHDKVEKAKADILEDGIIEGPKGPYVPHNSWNAGLETRTTSKSSGVKTPGYHGTPWP